MASAHYHGCTEQDACLFTGSRTAVQNKQSALSPLGYVWAELLKPALIEPAWVLYGVCASATVTSFGETRRCIRIRRGSGTVPLRAAPHCGFCLALLTSVQACLRSVPAWVSPEMLLITPLPYHEAEKHLLSPHPAGGDTRGR